MHRRTSVCGVLLSTCALSAVLSTVCLGQENFTVSLNTTPLVGNLNGSFYLDYQFVDGSGLGDGNNTVTLSNFNFFGGSASGSPTLTGGASGDIGSTVTLTDTSFFSEAYESFTPGSELMLSVDITTNVDAGPTPDEFTFALLDGNLNDIPTTSVADALVLVDIDSSTPAVQTFSATDPYSAIGTPIINFSSSPQGTPEPGSLALLAGVGIVGLLARRGRTRLYAGGNV